MHSVIFLKINSSTLTCSLHIEVNKLMYLSLTLPVDHAPFFVSASQPTSGSIPKKYSTITNESIPQNIA